VGCIHVAEHHLTVTCKGHSKLFNCWPEQAGLAALASSANLQGSQSRCVHAAWCAQHIKEAVEGQSKQAEATHAHMTKTAGTIWKVNANEFPR
jgi:hypothetical protein